MPPNFPYTSGIQEMEGVLPTAKSPWEGLTQGLPQVWHPIGYYFHRLTFSALYSKPLRIAKMPGGAGDYIGFRHPGFWFLGGAGRVPLPRDAPEALIRELGYKYVMPDKDARMLTRQRIGALNPWRGLRRIAHTPADMSLIEQAGIKLFGEGGKPVYRGIARTLSGTYAEIPIGAVSKAGRGWLKFGVGAVRAGAIISAVTTLGAVGMKAMATIPHAMGKVAGEVVGRAMGQISTRFGGYAPMLEYGYRSAQATGERTRALSMLRESYGIRRVMGNEAYLMHRAYGEI